MHQGIIAIFRLEYMRKPTVDDVQHIIEEVEEVLKQLESNVHTWRHYGAATIIVEAVASCDRWIWHCLFGVAGSNDEISVLNQSHTFTY